MTLNIFFWYLQGLQDLDLLYTRNQDDIGGLFGC